MRKADLVRPILLFTGVIAAAGPQNRGAATTDAFDPKAYASSSDFLISSSNYKHGDVVVLVAQVKRIGGPETTAPNSCRAWIEIRGGGRLKQIYYDDIAPVGGYYGIFLPRKQPLSPYFVAVKEGDYDGRLLLIGRDGSVSDLPGGRYFVTPDDRYIIGEHSTDGVSPLVVVDTTTRKVVLDGEKERQAAAINNWYQDAAGYFFTEPDESDDSSPQRDKSGVAYRLDLLRRKILTVPMSDTVRGTARRIRYQFDPAGMTDCTTPSK